ncbi:hypothetical protein IGI39_000085 [Enterococcus sp. AZ135]
MAVPLFPEEEFRTTQMESKGNKKLGMYRGMVYGLNLREFSAF